MHFKYECIVDDSIGTSISFDLNLISSVLRTFTLATSYWAQLRQKLDHLKPLACFGGRFRLQRALWWCGFRLFFWVKSHEIWWHSHAHTHTHILQYIDIYIYNDIYMYRLYRRYWLDWRNSIGAAAWGPRVAASTWRIYGHRNEGCKLALLRITGQNLCFDTGIFNMFHWFHLFIIL